MSQMKQNVWVVAILFLSLLSSVALSYIITPQQKTMTEQSYLAPVQEPTPVNEVKQEETKKKKASKMKQAMILLLPKVTG